MALTIKECLTQATRQLKPIAGETARLESEILLAHALQKTRTYLIAWSERALEANEQNAIEALIQRRITGEPIAYITGVREFWSMELQVTPDTLIPRPETECLVARALQLLEATEKPVIADLGTGSGAIALALATERPDSQVFATDKSPTALSIAESNARKLKLSNIHFIRGDWCRALPNEIKFDLIASNPPYIRNDDEHMKKGDLPYEPASALVSGIDGLDDIRTIALQASSYLKPNSPLLVEHGFDQGKDVRQILINQGFNKVITHPDWEHRDRFSEGFTGL